MGGEVRTYTPPRWQVPSPYGDAAAVRVMGTVAAPLLAATSSGLLALLLTSPANFRWPGGASISLTAAIFLFVACVQLTFWAVRFDVTAEEMLGWWADRDNPERQAHVASEQHWHVSRFEIWANRARWVYDLGVLCLLLSVLLMLVREGEMSWPQRIAAIAAALGALAEIVWIVLVHTKRPEFFDPPDYGELNERN